MNLDSGIKIEELRVDGGPTKNAYLMQFQSDIANIPVQVPREEELSGIGAAYAAGLALGLYDEEQIFSRMNRTKFTPDMKDSVREDKYAGWKETVNLVRSK